MTHRFSGIGLLTFSSIALLTLAVGLTLALAAAPHPPPADEGTLAHIFQLSVGSAFLNGLVFVITTDWTAPLRTVRLLAISAFLLTLAFGALYLGEHYLSL